MRSLITAKFLTCPAYGPLVRLLRLVATIFRRLLRDGFWYGSGKDWMCLLLEAGR